jgi:hypothetical protein
MMHMMTVTTVMSMTVITAIGRISAVTREGAGGSPVVAVALLAMAEQVVVITAAMTGVQIMVGLRTRFLVTTVMTVLVMGMTVTEGTTTAGLRKLAGMIVGEVQLIQGLRPQATGSSRRQISSSSVAAVVAGAGLLLAEAGSVQEAGVVRLQHTAGVVITVTTTLITTMAMAMTLLMDTGSLGVTALAVAAAAAGVVAGAGGSSSSSSMQIEQVAAGAIPVMAAAIMGMTPLVITVTAVTLASGKATSSSSMAGSTMNMAGSTMSMAGSTMNMAVSCGCQCRGRMAL